jgi:site-specific recombinase XerD
MRSRKITSNRQTLLGPWVRRFLLEHLVAERNLARNTQISYRDTLVLLLPFLSRTKKVPVDRLTLEELTSTVVRRFLDHLEKDRHCSVTTRNQRLGAIHSLAKFIATHSPEHLSWCTEVRNVPFKKTAKPVIPYLEKLEIDAVLKVPDRKTEHGERDYALLLFLYNTGARVDEAARLAIGDVSWGRSAAVRLVGKGSKTRLCPLWPKTAEVLKRLVGARAPQERVFLNRLGEPFTRFGIYALVRRMVTEAAQTVPSLKAKRVSPHCIRHASACHLLRAGVDINTIRAWLGHVSLSTTNVYAEVDLEMKAKALARADLGDEMAAVKRWRKVPGLIDFLKGI